MFTLWRFVSLPDVWQHRLRALFPLVGIALGVAVFLAVRVTNLSTLRAFERTVDAIAGRAGLEITGRGAPLDEAVLPLARRVPDVAAAQVLFDRVGRLDRIDVVPRQDFPLDTLQAALQQRLGPGVQVRRPQARNQAVEKMLRSFHVNLTALSLIALIVGMFLIYNSTTMAVVQRRRELGILRA